MEWLCKPFHAEARAGMEVRKPVLGWKSGSLYRDGSPGTGSCMQWFYDPFNAKAFTSNFMQKPVLGLPDWLQF